MSQQASHSQKAKRYLDLAKASSEYLDAYLAALDKAEIEEKEIGDQSSSPELREELQNKRVYIEYIQSHVHLHYIKMLTRMEQYRIELALLRAEQREEIEKNG